MCNPRVRPHLEFYPEDCGGRNVSEARQSSRMLNEIPDNELGPMVRLGHYDFYVFEPAKLRSGLVCMPHRWFKRNNRFHARCWKMQEIEHEHGRKSWRVIKGDGKFEVDEEQFLLPFPILATDVTLYPDLTDVTKIEGEPYHDHAHIRFSNYSFHQTPLIWHWMNLKCSLGR